MVIDFMFFCWCYSSSVFSRSFDLCRQCGWKVLVLDAIDQAARCLAVNAAVLLVVKRDAVACTLVAKAPHGINVQRTKSRPPLTASDDDVGLCVTDNMDAVRSLRDQCARNGVTFHHKQNGGIHGK